jgi:type II secretion system protein G
MCYWWYLVSCIILFIFLLKGEGKKMKLRKGFTLIELLVVIAIIGILASMVIVALSTARAKARDATRKSDLRQVKTALEVYYSDQSPNSYYVSETAVTISNTVLGGADQTYMKTVPTDPTAGRTYEFQSDADGQNYMISANLENDKDGERNTTAPTGFALSTDFDYFMQND